MTRSRDLPRRPAHAARALRGFSLIELMVAMAVGLVVTLAVTTMLIGSEESKRTITSLNDTSQTGAYLAYQLDRTLRSSGSGFRDSAQTFLGCELHAARDGTVVLPPPDAELPAPFATVGTRPVRLAPVLIHRDASAARSDVLAVMSGSAGRSEARVRLVSAETDQVALPNTLGVQADDLLLLVRDGVRCMVQQVASTFDNTASLDVPVTLDGDYHAATMGDANLVDFGDGGGAAYLIGNPATSPPQFQLIGVGDDRTLFSLDLLDLGGTGTPVPIADGVVALRALYGIDTDADGRFDDWVDPVDGTDFGAENLLDGSAAANARLQQIVAIRVALVLRTSLLEREALPLASLTVFPDLDPALQQTIELTGEDQRYRYRTVETTVPLRNAMP